MTTVREDCIAISAIAIIILKKSRILRNDVRES